MEGGVQEGGGGGLGGCKPGFQFIAPLHQFVHHRCPSLHFSVNALKRVHSALWADRPGASAGGHSFLIPATIQRGLMAVCQDASEAVAEAEGVGEAFVQGIAFPLEPAGGPVAHVHVQVLPAAIAGPVHGRMKMAVAGIKPVGLGGKAFGQGGIQKTFDFRDDVFGDDIGHEEGVAFEAGGEGGAPGAEFLPGRGRADGGGFPRPTGSGGGKAPRRFTPRL